jgi:hypothetical protein
LQRIAVAPNKKSQLHENRGTAKIYFQNVEENMKIDRTDAAFTDQKTMQEDDEKYWAAAPIEEKLEMITYLRDCFYGTEATTGRLQRFFEFAEQERRC